MGTLDEVRAWALARERYVIEVAGLAGLPPAVAGAAVTVENDAGHGGDPSIVRLRAELDRGGEALTHLLSALLAGGARIVACTRHEASLQEVFDMTVGSEAKPS